MVSHVLLIQSVFVTACVEKSDGASVSVEVTNAIRAAEFAELFELKVEVGVGIWVVVPSIYNILLRPSETVSVPEIYGIPPAIRVVFPIT